MKKSKSITFPYLANSAPTVFTEECLTYLFVTETTSQ